MLPEEFAFFLFYVLPENTGSTTKNSRGAGRSSNRKTSKIWYMNSEQLTVDSGQWTVDSGQWTVDSGQWTVEQTGAGPGKSSQMGMSRSG